MKFRKIILSVFFSGAVLLSGCSGGSGSGNDENKEIAENTHENDSPGDKTDTGEEVLPQIDMTQWQYNEETDVYWQVGIVYCEKPADETYENLGIYVPGAYMVGTENGDGTYTCEVNPSEAVGGYTAQTAPIVIPVDTPGYTAMAAPTGYVDSTSSYTDAGFVYVYAGCRGRDDGAPAGVTDLKAAIRYIRYCGDIIPGSTERIFSFGMSGGGAQSALLGATGDSELYMPYLKAVGAVESTSDAVTGSMCWCPITSLDYASEAYEWNLGMTRTDLSEDMQELSDAMAEQFALHINELGLKDENGSVLLLTASEDGIYQAGSYYDYLKTVIETSLNHFLADTTFPYTVADGGSFGGFGGDGFGGGAPDGKEFHGDGAPDGKEFDGKEKKMPEQKEVRNFDGITRKKTTGGISLSGTYETVQDYIDALNEQTEWVSYDSATNTASITSIADFVSALKVASKDIGAFDALDASQGENILFGDGDGTGAHFDAVMADLLNDSEYGEAYAADMLRTDALGTSLTNRVNMYTPLYYLNPAYEGYETAHVADYWRIRTGINQGDTALTTEVNLALALQNYGVVVDFETVWGQAHVEAERTGDSTANFIEWVTDCCR